MANQTPAKLSYSDALAKATKQIGEAVKILSVEPAAMQFFELLELTPVINEDVQMRLNTRDGGSTVYLEYNPYWMNRIDDPSILAFFFYGEILRVALHHCTTRHQMPAQSAYLASNLLVYEDQRLLSKWRDDVKAMLSTIPTAQQIQPVLGPLGFRKEKDWFFEKLKAYIDKLVDQQRENRAQQQQQQWSQQQKQRKQQGQGQGQQQQQGDGQGQQQQQQSGNGQGQQNQNQQGQGQQQGKRSQNGFDQNQQQQSGNGQGQDQQDQQGQGNGQNQKNQNGQGQQQQSGNGQGQGQNGEGQDEDQSQGQGGQGNGQPEQSPENGQSTDGNGNGNGNTDDGEEDTDVRGNHKGQANSDCAKACQEFFDNSEAHARSQTANWGENTMVEEEVQQIAQHIQKNPEMWGNMPAFLQEMIMAKNQGRFDPTRIVKHFKNEVQSEKYEETRSKANRRNPDLSGVRHKMKCSMGYFTDVSGSMSDRDVIMSKKFMQNFIKHVQLFEADWDTNCAEIVEVKKNYIKKNGGNVEITGRGGTQPQCIIEQIKKQKLKLGGIVVFTDCGFSWDCPPSKYRNKIFIIGTDDEMNRPPEWCKYYLNIKDIREWYNRNNK